MLLMTIEFISDTHVKPVAQYPADWLPVKREFSKAKVIPV